MSVQGKLTTMSMADVVEWLRRAQRTGVLSAREGNGREIKVIFSYGRIVFSSTNTKRETFSNYLAHLGLCSPEESKRARETQQLTGVMFASILVHSGALDAEVAARTLWEKTVEDICDVFLWKEGVFDFDPAPLVPVKFLRINLDPIVLVAEGTRRLESWNRLRSIVHPGSVYEAAGPSLPASAEWEDRQMAERLLPRFDGTMALGDVLEELPFSRYKVYRAAAELLEHGAIRQLEVTASGERETRLRRRLREVEAAQKNDRWGEAVQVLEGLATAHPGRREILDALRLALEGFRAAVLEQNFLLSDVPVSSVNRGTLAGLALDRSEELIVAMIDGRLPVAEILRIAPIPEVEGLRVFKRLLNAKVIDFPNRLPL